MKTPEHERATQPRSAFVQWLGLLGPAVVWLMQFQARYVLASATPGSARHAALIAIGLVALAAVGALALVSWRECRRAHASPLDQFAGVGDRSRFMAVLGLMTAALFFLIIVAQLLADLFIPPGKS